MQPVNIENLQIDKLILPACRTNPVKVDVLRLDKIHPVISGNKWFKLRYYFEEALQLNRKLIITFGGAWSNHIVATAAACSIHQLKSVGIIRGERPRNLSSSLREAESYGMQLHFLSREDYSKKIIPDHLINEHYYLVPEGGYGLLGARGAGTILKSINLITYSHICCAVGTGTMIAGLATAVTTQQVVGISVLKNNFEIENSIRPLTLGTHTTPDIHHEYHFGGYAKYNQVLIDFMNACYATNQLPLDFVYTGKLCYAINDLIAKGHFAENARLLIIHSGGLQGNLSLRNDVLIF